MAQDQVEVMKHLGFEKFAVVGTTAADAPLTGCPRPPGCANQARHSRHCANLHAVSAHHPGVRYGFLSLVSAGSAAAVPETLVAIAPNISEVHIALAWGHAITDPIPDWLGAETFREYLRCFSNPESIHAICEDYRAAASIDLAHDAADLGRKSNARFSSCVRKGPFHRMYNVLQTWQERAKEAKGKPLPTGHFLPEQLPQELTQELKSFLSA